MLGLGLDPCHMALKQVKFYLIWIGSSQMAITFSQLLCFSTNPNALIYIVWIFEIDPNDMG
jgi:hypothetical protein